MNLFLFDLESTGVDPSSDKIIQIAWQLCSWPDLKVIEQYEQLIDPERSIPTEVTEITGIDIAKVTGQPVFEQVAPTVIEALSQAEIIGGYNNFAFDNPLLNRELTACGYPGALEGKRVMDVYKMVTFYTSQKLEGMYRLLTGTNMRNAHDAMADVEATRIVAERYMQLLFKLGLAGSPDAAIDDPMDTIVDPGGFLAKENGQIVFKKGKCAGKTMEWVIKNNRGYLTWILGQDSFDPVIKESIKHSLSTRQAVSNQPSLNL